MTDQKLSKTLALLAVFTVTFSTLAANVNAVSDIGKPTSTSSNNEISIQTDPYIQTQARQIINRAGDVVMKNDKLFSERKLTHNQLRAIYLAADKIAPPIKIDVSNKVIYKLEPIIKAENNLAYATALNKILTDNNPEIKAIINAAKTLSDPDDLSKTADALATIIQNNTATEHISQSDIDYN